MKWMMIKKNQNKKILRIKMKVEHQILFYTHQVKIFIINFKNNQIQIPLIFPKNKVPVEINTTGIINEKDFNQDKSGSDLDVPGSELDDEQEKIGNEDEENNYYSLGGDDHNDLEENLGDNDLA